MRALAAMFLLMLTGMALADGKFFRTKMEEVPPSIPFQRAVLKFDGREQIMLVESSLSGPRGTYGWVVPLPSKPSYVKAVNPAFVEQSFAKAKPYIRSNRGIEPILLVLAFVFAATALTSGLRYKNKPLGLRVLYFFLELGMLFMAVAVLFPVFSHAKSATKGYEGAGGAERSKATVEDLGTIGSYQVSVVSGDRGQEILDWLKEHDLAVEDDALPVIEAYAKEGWCFLAAEIRKDEDGVYPPHPLKAVFPSEELVYPMRLTGLQSEPLRLELLVVSDKEAIVPGMKPWACDNTTISVPIAIASTQDKDIYKDWNSGLYAMAKQGAVWTYLRGEFKPEEMRTDFLVDWKPMERSHLEVWEQQAAMTEAVHKGALYLVFAAVGVGLILACYRGITDKVFALGVLVTFMMATSGAAYWHESVEKVQAIETQYRPIRHR